MKLTNVEDVSQTYHLQHRTNSFYWLGVKFAGWLTENKKQKKMFCVSYIAHTEG